MDEEKAAASEGESETTPLTDIVAYEYFGRRVLLGQQPRGNLIWDTVLD